MLQDEINREYKSQIEQMFRKKTKTTPNNPLLLTDEKKAMENNFKKY